MESQRNTQYIQQQGIQTSQDLVRTETDTAGHYNVLSTIYMLAVADTPSHLRLYTASVLSKPRTVTWI